MKEFKKNLAKVTNKSILNFSKNDNNLKLLEHRNKKINKSNIYLIDKIYWLLEDCKKYGTFTFSGAARCGFIAIDMLQSMIRKKIINENEKNEFLNSIEWFVQDSCNGTATNCTSFFGQFQDRRGN